MRMRYRTIAHKASSKFFLLDILEGACYFTAKELIESAQKSKAKKNKRMASK